MKILRSVHRHDGRQEEVEKPVYTAADYYPNVSQYCTSDEFSNIMDATAAAEAAKAAAEAAEASANKACECADRACQCAIQAEEAAHEAQQAIDTVNAAKEAAENAASSAQISADTAQAAADAVKDVADQAEASADRAAAEAVKACECADAAKVSETAAAESAAKAEDVYEAFAKSAVYRGVWNPQSGAYPDHKNTNSYWDVILNEGDESDSFDGKTWRPGDRLIYSSVEKKYHHVPFPGGGAGGVVSVNGMTGAVTITADSLNVYTKDKVYTKDETYRRGEVYSKEEVYRKEETYRRGEVYLKNETYNREETYDKEEVDALLANAGGGGSGGSVKKLYKPFKSSFPDHFTRVQVRVTFKDPVFKGKLTVEVRGYGLNIADKTVTGSYTFDVDSQRTDNLSRDYPVMVSKYSSQDGELIQPLDKGYYVIAESSTGSGNAFISFYVFLAKGGYGDIIVTDYSGEDPNTYGEVLKVQPISSQTSDVPTSESGRPVQTIELMDFTPSGGGGAGGGGGDGVTHTSYYKGEKEEAGWVTFAVKIPLYNARFKAVITGSNISSVDYTKPQNYVLLISGWANQLVAIKASLVSGSLPEELPAVVYAASSTTLFLSIPVKLFGLIKFDVMGEVTGVTNSWSATKPNGAEVKVDTVLGDGDKVEPLTKSGEVNIPSGSDMTLVFVSIKTVIPTGHIQLEGSIQGLGLGNVDYSPFRLDVSGYTGTPSSMTGVLTTATPNQSGAFKWGRNKDGFVISFYTRGNVTVRADLRSLSYGSLTTIKEVVVYREIYTGPMSDSLKVRQVLLS